MMKGKGMHMVAVTLLWIGGLNWLLVGLFQWDIGQLFGGMDAGISRVIYVLVGLAALFVIFTHKDFCKHCGDKGSMSASGTPSA